MSNRANAAAVWADKGVALDSDYVSTRVNNDARDDYDEYQYQRHLVGDLETELYWNNAKCEAQPSLDVSDIDASAAWQNPPTCHRLAPKDLAWERQEQIFSSRRAADNLRGPASDKFLADPSAGWSDVVDPKAAQMRLASGVAMTATNAVSFAGDKSLVDRNVGAGVAAAPSASAIAPSAAALSKGYAAMYEQSRVGGSNNAAAFNLRPGFASR